MRRREPVSGCACCEMSRWRFLTTSCAGCVGATAFLAAPRGLRAAAQEGKTRIRIVYALHAVKQPGPDWPNKGFDFGPVMERINIVLVKRRGSAANFAAAATKLRIERTPKPGDLTCLPDEVNTISPRECLRRMKESKILAVRDQQSGPSKPILGIPTRRVSFAELSEACKAADKDQARAIADRWQQTASAVVALFDETLEASAAMYLAMKALLKKYGAPRRAGRRLGEAVYRVGSPGLAPGHLLRRPEGAGPRACRRHGVEGSSRDLIAPFTDTRRPVVDGVHAAAGKLYPAFGLAKEHVG